MENLQNFLTCENKQGESCGDAFVDSGNNEEVKEQNASQPQSAKSNAPKEKSIASKKREQQDFRRRYFDYYDDVKTNIKEDW